MNVIHTVVNTFTAKRFIEPLILSEIEYGLKSSLLVDPLNGSSKFLDALRCKYIKSKFCFSLNPFLLIVNLIRLICFFKKNHTDIIICHMTKGAFLPLLASFIFGIKRRVYYNHGVPYIGYSGLLKYALKSIEKINCFFATDILTVNKELVPYLSCLTYKNVSVIGSGSISGLPNEFYDNKLSLSYIDDLKEKHGIDKNMKVFIYVGRPHKRKGFNLLLKSFEKTFSHTNTKPLLLIVGCTSKDVKTVLGYIPDSFKIYDSVLDIHELYKCSDFAVLPSYHEGLGYALLEGAAASCILLGSDIIGLNVLCRKENSIKFTLQIDGLSTALLKAFLMDEKEKMKMASSSFTIANEFRQKSVTQNYISYLYSK
ncbi:glycosyltransferase [Photorhabdus laumondii subsp. laumondii]|uniref:WblU protein n=2 Tax=Photorhabdus laumondii subsp. laumondii TaxID=141679 RepID=Q7MY68_PHOLL|nr:MULTISPECIES: glycosyltransferase [Photorhabdus]AWK44316.1 hypothetical protein A4R40_23975 [Photorhabdus laumondii subsp. laumondii]AXG45047.1 hypothetical protein PluDJC_24250 [Photorhabdus laumondii subsp. laumondii]AXG49630.1 hypothetical protein PluTT01m_24745 [Photorhabdus laumondii subsp. laumondii]MCC8386130.1 glycosyltransferase [Photorhabdus laumondii]MCC8390606.1 glycosyltransferase [Photorhabdus laumondii]